MSLDPVFDALADPTRRLLIERLADGDTVTASGMAAELPMSRQAVAKHLGSLEAAGLVSSRRVGREVRFCLEAAPLVDAARWVASVGDAWDARLGRLARLLTATDAASAADR